jgi:hypothetical protein
MSAALETLLKAFLKSIWTKTLSTLVSRAERRTCPKRVSHAAELSLCDLSLRGAAVQALE